MHPRNPYVTAPDFAELAESYPALKNHLMRTAAGTSIDFHDIKAQRCLTQALLHRDFGLILSIPDDRLCPPVPNRMNYILWLQDIMNASQTKGQGLIVGADIGTGASAIYPLLGCAISKDWRFVATDVDAHSLDYARNNVKENDLGARIQVLEVSVNDPIFSPGIFALYSQLDFTMCNPPFYGDREEVLKSAEAKEFGPNAVCTGADTEMITPGGEVAFVSEMVQESLTLKSRCRWYSSMLGKMSSLTSIVETLRNSQIENYAITEFVQGKTRRWALAWSFTDERLPDSLARISNPALQSVMPPRNTLKQPLHSRMPTNELLDVLKHVLSGIGGIEVEPLSSLDDARDKGHSQLSVHATGNTWSRAARRKKLAGTVAEPLGCVMPALSCRIGVIRLHDISEPQISLEFQWLRGEDRGLFESFMAHVSRKVEATLESPEVKMVV
ncbi:S-adenosyl-L-methionine dependent methyltransferase [Irpex rosettiformis]|uniref:S-adenosyl-L-methionine dependent methyltransferase n=1 Tax=Irpex rosettiformis TaxID=378272 RepID=A0ACB8UHM7_9APHY|nr:S-adenosyl-L-methionine dependent methyltransferase [Irpex rosettiformis]